VNFIDELGFKMSWERFLGGHWTRERPTKTGYYPIQAIKSGDPDGTPPSMLILVYELDGEIHYTQSWGGWWWSHPLPDLPPAPDAAEADHGDC
jgi:hypothetical protein